MSQNKRRKMDLGAACSSASVNTQEMSTSVLDAGGEAHIAQQTARANCGAGSRFTNENKKKEIFNMTRSDFKEAVKWSGFVDRSLLIKELLSGYEYVIIFAPKRFGKSMNLDMVKCFLEIEGDRDVTNAPQEIKDLKEFENFKAFSRYNEELPCKILAEENLVIEHFGRHPVLYIDFKKVRVDSIQEVKYSVRQLIHFAYEEHSYLQNGEIFSDSTKNKNANKACRIWCDEEKYEKKDARGGLEKLIKYLHAYHKRKVYLLVDEFDAPAVEGLLAGKSGDEVKNISNQVTKLLGDVIKGPIAEQHLLGSLITGVSYLGSVGISQNLNNVPIYKWLLDDTGRFAGYYGLGHNELTTLLEHVFPNQEQEQKRVSMQEEVKGLYNGYNFKGEAVYCLWSVLHYIQRRSTSDASEITKTTFWGGSSIISEMGSVLRHSSIMKQMMKVMSGGCIFFSFCEKVSARNLAELLNGSTSFGPNNIVVSFFLEQGYLTRVPDQREHVHRPNKQIRVKIPNADVLFAFQEMFYDFSLNVCGLDEAEMSECAAVFESLPKERDYQIFKKKLGDFYNHLEALLQKFDGLEGVNERSLQSALYTTMLKTGFKECCMEKYVTVDSENGKIDLWLFDDNFASIFEMKCIESDNDDSLKESAQQALKEILSGSKTKKVPPYVKILEQYSNIKNYLLIGLSMNSKGKPRMCCLVNSLNKEKDCISFPEGD